uniref:glutaredoxin family protein n=1 Tax=Castellaniella defragrans TaxID=75697 RepID=UPI003341D096
MSVTVYSKPNCPQCDLTKRDMDILGIEYETVDLTQRQDQLERLIGLGHRSAPVVETSSETWSGYNQEKIKGLVSYA